MYITTTQLQSFMITQEMKRTNTKSSVQREYDEMIQRDLELRREVKARAKRIFRNRKTKSCVERFLSIKDMKI